MVDLLKEFEEAAGDVSVEFQNCWDADSHDIRAATMLVCRRLDKIIQLLGRSEATTPAPERTDS